MDKSEKIKLQTLAAEIRLETLGELKELGFGHIGGSMSIADLLAVLYGKQLRHDPKDPQWESRDWLVCSKGHAGPAIYAALAIRGYFPKEQLLTLNKPGTCLPSHCDRLKTPGIDMTTGSLGQGMSTAAGVAMAKQVQGRKENVYLVLGDGECDEGQVWEGAMFCAAKKLDNLIAFVDYNKFQLDGAVADILDQGDVPAKWEAFGWFTQSIDGHDVEAISAAIDAAKAQSGKPSMIVLNTQKGHGALIAEATNGKCHSMKFKSGDLDESIAHIKQVVTDLRAMQ